MVGIIGGIGAHFTLARIQTAILQQFAERLARSDQARRTPSGAGARPEMGPVPFEELIEAAAKRHNLPAQLIKAVIWAESNFDPKAVSSAGAKGLMQLMDATAKALGVEDSFDPAQNIEGGVTYLRRLLDRYGDVSLALAAYNAGPGAVDRYGGIPPYAETQTYVRRVLEAAGVGEWMA